MSFAELAKSRRRALGLTQRELAARIPVGSALLQCRISDFERGAATPDHHQARLLGEALGLSTPEEWAEWHEALAEADAQLRGRTTDEAA